MIKVYINYVDDKKAMLHYTKVYISGHATLGSCNELPDYETYKKVCAIVTYIAKSLYLFLEEMPHEILTLGRGNFQYQDKSYSLKKSYLWHEVDTRIDTLITLLYWLSNEFSSYISYSITKEELKDERSETRFRTRKDNQE